MLSVAIDALYMYFDTVRVVIVLGEHFALTIRRLATIHSFDSFLTSILERRLAMNRCFAFLDLSQSLFNFLFLV